MNYLLIAYIVLIVGLFFFMRNASKKRTAQAEKMRNEMQKGTEVITIGGLHGTIFSIDKETNTITLDLEGVKAVFESQSIRQIAPNPVLNKTSKTTTKKTSAKKTTVKK